VKRGASVLVACYEQAEVLELALAGFARQSWSELELVIADDGSNQDLAPQLARWAPRFAHGIRWVRHAKQGFRKTRILNRAASVARFGALIFSDADCVPHRHFVRDHVLRLAPGVCVSGRRVHVERDGFGSAAEILAGGVGLPPWRLLWLRWRRRASRIEHGLALPWGADAGALGILGSNFSLQRGDLDRVNGFDEGYQAWGIGEDTDLDLRLRFAGVRVRVFRHGLVQYHVAHAGARVDDPANRQRLEQARAQRRVRAQPGLAEIRDGDFESRAFA